jgi:hypothetical protein
MIKRIFFIVVLIFGSYVYAQNNDCKVVIPEISGSYSGSCKNGLANGKGIAQGVDHYEGQFTKGKPDGKGIYKWADGSYYEGQWKNGLREGIGKMVNMDSVVTGYWKEGVFMGEKPIPPFKVVYSLSVSRYSITKIPGVGNGVKIRIMQAGNDNPSVEGFSLVFSSGNEYRSGNIAGIENSLVPLDIKVAYRSMNLIRTAQYDVRFEFTINEPGMWNVVINN